MVFNGDGEFKKEESKSADGRSKEERGGPRRSQAGERETTKDRDAGTGERRVKNKAGASESQTGSWCAGSLRDARSKNPGSLVSCPELPGSLVSCPGRKVKSTKSRVIGAPATGLACGET